MARHRLSESNLKRLTKPGIYSDGDGLFVRVRKGGSRQFIFIYRRGAERTELGLGGIGRGTAPVSLDLAREKAESIRDQLARGIDPRAERKPVRVVTFKHCMEELLESKADAWTNAKHKSQWEMTLRAYAKPLHDLPVADIAIGDVKAALAPHWQKRPETASRLRARIQAVLDYAIVHEWRSAGNVARWRGVLDKVLPPPRKLGRGHHAALAFDAMPATTAALRVSNGTAARAVEFLALTATRCGETRGATFAEVDEAKKLWTIPAERMKAKKPHAVPLCDRALEIIAAMRQRATGDVIFEGGTEGRPVSETAMQKALRLASPDKSATLHGLRSTFRDWCGDATGFPREIAEAALAHVISNKVEAAYRRGDALAKRRKLMLAWAAFCASA